jgi:mRNA interferase MazF
MQEGDIYLVEIPASNGHEQAGSRPAIIIQSIGIEKVPTVLVIPLTSQIKATGFPFTLLIEPDRNNNLDIVSVALLFQLRAIDKRRLKNKLGKISLNKLKIIKQKLCELMGLIE